MAEGKQRVLIVHNYNKIPGGEDTVVANEKKLLEEHGHEVLLYTRHNSEMKTMSKVQKLLLPFSTIFNWNSYREIKRIIKTEKIDIVHVHNTLNMISPSVYYAALRCRVPVVQTIHNFRLLCPAATFYRDGHICEECLERGFSCAVKHSCYRNSKIQTLACVISLKIHRLLGIYGKLNYICLTEFNKEKLLHLKQIVESKVYVKPNFVKEAENIVPYKERKNQFIYVGRLEEIKGTRLLLESWKLLGEAAPTLLVCGRGPMEEWAKEFVKEHQISQVKLLGYVDNQQVKKMIGESKALILPTQVYEGFPMTIAEAYAAGTPVIAPDMGNAGDLVTSGVTGVHFEHRSAVSLADVISDFKTFDSVQIHNVYENHFSAEKNYEQLKKIYDCCGSITHREF